VNIQWTFSEHSVNIQWTFSEYSVNIQWTFSAHSINIRWPFDNVTIRPPANRRNKTHLCLCLIPKTWDRHRQ
jgi:hypothetical protein